MRDPKAEGLRWLKQAVLDLEAGRTIIRDHLWWLACFQAQQAAEKAVKAFLYACGERIVLGHSVRELAEKAAVRDGGFGAYVGIATQLDRFYIPTRYPNGLPGGVPAETYSEEEASGAIELATKIVDFVRGQAVFADCPE